MRVYVLLFNARTENEGIHTIQLGENHVVLMFESEDDATRYALLLEAQDFPTPTPEPIDQEEIEEFCRSAGYLCKLIPENFVPETEADRLLLAPPETNVEETEWQPDREEEEEEEAIAETDLDRIRRQLEGLL